MNELTLFPAGALASSKLLIVNFGKKEVAHSLKLLEKIQNAGIKAEIYPDAAKMKKQLKYADQKRIPFVLLAGEEEMENEIYSLKNMHSGEQLKLKLEEIIDKIK